MSGVFGALGFRLIQKQEYKFRLQERVCLLRCRKVAGIPGRAEGISAG